MVKKEGATREGERVGGESDQGEEKEWEGRVTREGKRRGRNGRQVNTTDKPPVKSRYQILTRKKSKTSLSQIHFE